MPAPWIWQLVTEQPDTAQEAILGQLRSVILDGLAAPGVEINVDDVAERFTVSRIPVREALKTLIGEGLVDHVPRRGYQVTQLTRAELGELYVVREALESAALSVAVSHATEPDDLAVDAAYLSLAQAIGFDDSRAHHRESRRFHLALAKPAGMPRLLHMFESAWNITEPQQPMSHVSPGVKTSLDEDHRRMADAFHSRDAEALLAACGEHYVKLQAVVAGLPEHGLRR